MVQSLGVPLTEAGCLLVNGVPVTPGYRPGGGEVARIGAVTRPQPVPVARFVLDVHLGRWRGGSGWPEWTPAMPPGWTTTC